jgi:WD repeat-containing protein 59
MILQKVGHVPEVVRGRSKLTRNELETIDTFRNVPENQDYFPAFSAPTGPRAILAECRAPQPPKAVLAGNLGLGPTFSPSLTTDEDSKDATPTLTSTGLKLARQSTGETMSKGNSGLKTVGQVDQLTWLASVKFGDRRGSSSGGTGSDAPSRLNSRSRPHSGPDRSVSEIGVRPRSRSLSRAVGDERKEGDGGQSLQDELVSRQVLSSPLMLMFLRITSVLKKLESSKIKLEKV